MPIRTRLVVLVVAIVAALVAAGGVLVATSLQAGMRATLVDSLRRAALRADADLAGRGPAAPQAMRPVAVGDQNVVQVLAANGSVAYATPTAGRASLLSPAERAAASRGTVLVQRSLPGWHDPHLLLAEHALGTAGLVLVVGRSLDELENATARLRLVLVVGGPLVVVAAGAGAWLLAGMALRPVERLRREAAAISQQQSGRRLAEPGTRDEVARLARTFNALLDRLHGVLDSQRRFVADASHELRTPVAAMRAELETARRPGRSHAELRRSLDVLARRVEQLVRMSEDLLLLARGDEGVLHLQAAEGPVEPAVARSLQALRPLADAGGVDLVLDADPGVVARVDGDRLQQVVDNLVANALAHAPQGSVVEVQVRRAPGGASIEVLDRGPGFPDELLPRVFDRFATACTARRGDRQAVGLGLAVVRTIAVAHGGTVAARNRRGGGASVVVTLPSAVAGTVPAPGDAWPPPPEEEELA